MTNKRRFAFLLLLLLAVSACNALASPTDEPLPTMVAESISINSTDKIPATEAEVPRVSLEDAYKAFNEGSAVIVDVRSQEAYAAGHIPGAVNIPLSEFETDPANIDIPKGDWIITYCT